MQSIHEIHLLSDGFLQEKKKQNDKAKINY